MDLFLAISTMKIDCVNTPWTACLAAVTNDLVSCITLHFSGYLCLDSESRSLTDGRHVRSMDIRFAFAYVLFSRVQVDLHD
jgi:hypothetical protein